MDGDLESPCSDLMNLDTYLDENTRYGNVSDEHATT